MNLLVIDDSASERAMLAAKLKHWGHSVTCAASGEGGIRLLTEKQDEFDLILLDVLMPGIDGLATARRIRELEDEHDMEWIPIIFLSGRVDAETVAAGIEAGGDDYLAKPTPTPILRAKMLAMQRISAMRRRLADAKRLLEKQANFDELTGVFSRRHFTAKLHTEAARADRHRNPLTIAYLDIDHFKRVNDTYGHKAGDTVLHGVAGHLERIIREEDFIGRMGGEEFCLCMPNIDPAQALQACERFREAVEGLTFDCGVNPVRVTVSIGLTTYQPGNDTVSTLINRADGALYQAKQGGRNRVETAQLPFSGMEDNRVYP